MKVKNPSTGNFEEVYVKALDSLPVGSEIDFTGSASDIPVGWEQTNNDDLFLKPGDTLNLDEWYGGGYITGSAMVIAFTIPLIKRKGTTSSATFTAGNVSIRSVNGTYLENKLLLTDSKVSIAYYKDGYATVNITSSTAYNITNNTPVGVAINNSVISFS